MTTLTTLGTRMLTAIIILETSFLISDQLLKEKNIHLPESRSCQASTFLLFSFLNSEIILPPRQQVDITQ